MCKERAARQQVKTLIPSASAVEYRHMTFRAPLNLIADVCVVVPCMLVSMRKDSQTVSASLTNDDAGRTPAGWAPEIRGQISPLGKYDDYTKSSEYFFNMPTITALRGSFARGGFPYAGDQTSPTELCCTEHTPEASYLTPGKVVITRMSTGGNMVRCALYLKAEVAGDQAVCATAC